MGGTAKRVFELGGGFSIIQPQVRFTHLRLPPSGYYAISWFVAHG